MIENTLENHQGQQQVRRSGRCRTVNSIYADSIGELKRAVKRPTLPLKKLSHKSNFDDLHESEDYQARISLEREMVEDYRKAEITLQDGSVKMIEVLIQPPKKQERRSTRVVKPVPEAKRTLVATPSVSTIKRKSSAFKSVTKEPLKEAQKQEPKSLLNIMLNLAMKMKQQQNGEEEVSQDQEKSEEMNLQNSLDRPGLGEDEFRKGGEFKFRSKAGFEKDEGSRKLAKMELKFQNLKRRYQQIRPKMIFSIFQKESAQ